MTTMIRPSFLRSYPRPNHALLQLVTGLSRSPFRSLETRVVATRLDRSSARAIECLAHAIEYLEDTKPFSAESTPRIAAVEEAIRLLKARNRDVFFSCSTASQRNAAQSWADTLSTGHDDHIQWAGDSRERFGQQLAS